VASASVSRPSIASVARLASSAASRAARDGRRARGSGRAVVAATSTRRSSASTTNGRPCGPARERARQRRVARRHDRGDAERLEQLLAHGGRRGQRIERAHDPRVAVAVPGERLRDRRGVEVPAAGDVGLQRRQRRGDGVGERHGRVVVDRVEPHVRRPAAREPAREREPERGAHLGPGEPRLGERPTVGRASRRRDAARGVRDAAELATACACSSRDPGCASTNSIASWYSTSAAGSAKPRRAASSSAARRLARTSRPKFTSVARSARTSASASGARGRRGTEVYLTGATPSARRASPSVSNPTPCAPGTSNVQPLRLVSSGRRGRSLGKLTRPE
jgi:hypothetical protein